MSWFDHYSKKNADLEEIFGLISEVLKENANLKNPRKKSCSLFEDDLKILDEVADIFGSGEFLTEASERMRREEAEKFLVSLPRFIPSEAWGKPESVDRKTVNRIFAVMGGGRSVEGKLGFLQRITHPNNRITSPRRVLSSLLILEALSTVITNFNEAAAGFVFEGWLAALLQGHQEAERTTEKGNLPIEDLIAFSQLKEGGSTVPVSLKLLSPTTPVHGSYTNLVDSLFGDNNFDGVMNYVVARKLSPRESGVQSIAFQSFDISRENFIDVLTLTEGSFERDPDRPSKFFIDPETGERVKGTKVKMTGGRLFMFKKEHRERLLAAYPEASGGDLEVLKMVQGTGKDWKLLYHLLQHTQGYTAPIREPDAVDTTEEVPEEASEETSEEVPEDQPSHQPRTTARMAPINEAADGVHKGWSISHTQIDFLAGKIPNFVVQNLGELPASRDEIIKVAMNHMDVVREKFTELFRAFASLNENINKYMTFPARSAAIAAGERAITNTGEIQEKIKENVASDVAGGDETTFSDEP